MRFVAAGLLAALLVGGMFLFHAQMVAYQEKWIAENAALPPVALSALNVADWWGRYWYAGSMAILLVCAGIAAVLPRRRA